MGMGVAAACTIISIVMDGNIADFINGPSIFVVVGGTFGAMIANYPMEDIKKLMTLVKFAIQKSDLDLNKQIDDIVDMANIARKNGLLALEDKVKDMEDPFLRNGVMLILDGTDPELVKNVMETSVYFMDERHSKYASIFFTGSSLAPAFGMIGTLIGLINMLTRLDDPSTLGPAMAVALVTTFYGVILANVLFNPIANQLKLKSQNEQIQKDIIIEGILSIQDGENPRVIKDKLRAFVADADLGEAEAQSAQAGGE
ncbi:MAG TPA: motility protein A [Clostridiales bacterium]|nr:motility protein A [Clostridiales bacterium]